MPDTHAVVGVIEAEREFVEARIAHWRAVRARAMARLRRIEVEGHHIYRIGGSSKAPVTNETADEDRVVIEIMDMLIEAYEARLLREPRNRGRLARHRGTSA
jgi:hypothetical protein